MQRGNAQRSQVVDLKAYKSKKQAAPAPESTLEEHELREVVGEMRTAIQEISGHLVQVVQVLKRLPYV